MQINIQYDSSVTSLPSALQAEFKTAVNAAVAFWDHALDDPVTVTIDFGYGTVGPHTISKTDVGENWIFFDFYSYSTLVSALDAHATTAIAATAYATLPATDPTSGGKFALDYAQSQLFGISNGLATSPNYIALSAADPIDWSPYSRAAPGDYDAVGTLEHEISEVLGRYEGLGSIQGANVYTVMDLFRYSSPGVRTLSLGPGSFSIDGHTLLAALNNPNNGGDPGDWSGSVVNDAFDAFLSQDAALLVSPLDLQLMQVLGYKIAAPTPMDFSADGVTDFLYADADGTYSQWLMSGAAAAPLAINNLGNPGAGWRLVGTGDLNGDLTTDLLFEQPNSTLTVWDMYNSEIVANANLGTLASGWQVAGIGDFNGDGAGDVLVENIAQQQYDVWLTNGAAAASVVAIGSAPSPAWEFAAVGDFNGDGKADILFELASNDTFGVWMNSGAGPTFTVTTGLSFGPGWTFVGVGDFNGDGKTDLLLESADTTQLEILEWSGTTFVTPGPIANPLAAAGARIVGIGDYGGGADDGLLIRDEAGNLHTEDFNGTAFASGYTITPGQDGAPAAGPVLEGFSLPFTYDSILFSQSDGALASWVMNSTAIVGGGGLGSPGGTWAEVGTGDFYANGAKDILFQDATGNTAIWEMNGTTIIGGGAIGDPGGTWAVKGVGDFNGDGHADILFQDAGGNLALWEMSGTSIIGGGAIGNPGGTWAAMGVGDFNGDGKADILFEDADGDYAIWEMSGTSIIGGGDIGNPGAGWTEKGVGDFNGDGMSDILFENASGEYAIWEMDGTAIIGGGNIGDPGGTWQFAGIGDYNGDGHADILFTDAAGDLAIWEMNGTQIIGGGQIGNPGAGWHVLG